MPKTNPYAPTQPELEPDSVADDAHPKSHWFVRVMISTIGLTICGMVVAVAMAVRDVALNWISVDFLSVMALTGIRLLYAGIVDRPPKALLPTLAPRIRSRPFE